MRVMKKMNHLCMAMMVCMLMLLPEQSQAGQLEFHPRIETGIMDYSLKYGAVSESNLKLPGQLTGFNMVRKEAEYRDQMSLVGGGATLSFNRFFIDLSGKYAYDGDDSYPITYSTYDEDFGSSEDEDFDGFSFFTSTEGFNQARFDYSARAVAVGYSINPALSIFVGYRWTDVDADQRTEGTVYVVAADYHVMSRSPYRISSDISLKYEGPFIGTTSGWEIDTLRFLKGVVTLKLGLAYLTSKYTHSHNFWIHYEIIDEEEKYAKHNETEGETWGFTLGLGWRGNTPVRNLTYAVNIDGYRYNFSNDNRILGDITESALTYRAELAYAF